MDDKCALLIVDDHVDVRSVASHCLFVLMNGRRVAGQFCINKGTGTVRTVATFNPSVFRELMVKFADIGTEVTFFRESGNHTYRYGV